MKNKDEDLFEFIKDITQFLTTDETPTEIDVEKDKLVRLDRNLDPSKRNTKTSLILDVKPTNFILNPDNCIPCEEYNADSPYTSK